jgi:hypothetical protein
VAGHGPHRIAEAHEVPEERRVVRDRPPVEGLRGVPRGELGVGQRQRRAERAVRPIVRPSNSTRESGTAATARAKRSISASENGSRLTRIVDRR